LTGKIELVDDSIALNEEFKKNVAIPYFKDIYKDLVQWSDNKTKGINKVSILTVILNSLTCHYIVFSAARNYRRKILLSTRLEWR
jgi:hypothetical protein